MNDGAILTLTQWLVDAGLRGVDQQALLEGLCEELVGLGIPLMRAVAGADLLHPTLDARVFRWRRDHGVDRDDHLRSDQIDQAEEWLRSPFAFMLDNKMKQLRRRLADGYEQGEFPLLDQLRADGGTDYVGFLIGVDGSARVGSLDGMICSWTIDRPGGYTDDEIALLGYVVRPFGLAFHTLTMAGTVQTLLDTYLGTHAAARVLKGNVARGRAEPMRSVIWYSDLAGFTRIADSSEHHSVLALLNEYAECLVDIVEAHGGHVLKFIGDGILAIFPDDDHEQACGRALDAALAGEAAVTALNARRRDRGEEVTDFYLALHAGDLMYGNFGSRNRLDFTVLGPTVNEASRIGAMCRSVDQRVVVSSAFAAAAGDRRDQLVSLGRYALRGVARPQELFTIDRS